MDPVSSPSLAGGFAAILAWQAIAPGTTRLSCQAGVNDSLALAFDLGSGGFVIARRKLPLALPEDFSFSLRVRAEGAPVILEFKLVDERLGNVWRYRDDHRVFPGIWTSLVITAAELAYAWGARQAARPEHVDHLEIALVGSGTGTVWLSHLVLEDLATTAVPTASASSVASGHVAQAVLGGDAPGWRAATGGQQWLECRFAAARAISALIIDWLPGAWPAGFVLKVAEADGSWREAYALARVDGPRSPVLLPGVRTGALRLELQCGDHPCGVAHLVFKPWHFARTVAAGLAGLARLAPTGHYPKWLHGQQSYWTVVGAAAGSPPALVNTEGLIEPGHGDFGVECFVRVGDRLYTWADVALTSALAVPDLPLPRVCWHAADFALEITPSVTTRGEHTTLFVDYAVRNLRADTLAIELILVVRPFLVNPAWQQWRGRGGISVLTCLHVEAHRVLANGARSLSVSPPADAVSSCHASALIQGLVSGITPGAARTFCADGMASAALVFRRSLAPGAACVVRAKVPATCETPADCAAPLQEYIAAWRAALGNFALELPAPASVLRPALQAAAAHILINRDGPRLQPGPRRYRRAWLRDGVGMGTALARLGLHAPLREFLAWYATFQREDGELPDCIDDDGAEWLPEYDAFGQFLHGLALCHRHAPDQDFCARLWPHALRTLARFTALRDTRRTAAFDFPPLRARRGLLPESMSHEGYMAQPVHAYWDDFWALRGLRDLAWLAGALGDSARAAQVSALARDFHHDVIASLNETILAHGIHYLPGSVELGDFDPTASAIAITVAELDDDLPQVVVHRTFDRYLEGLAARESSTDWQNYSAYEVRIVGALVRLGRRDDALRVLFALLADCRPPAWHQWPEQSWRELDAPAFLGDLPHSWIGAEFIHATTSLFAYARDADQELVLAAGVALDWLASPEPVVVRGLHTAYGVLGFSLARTAPLQLEMQIDPGLHLPPGGLVLRPPLPGRLRGVVINDVPCPVFTPDGCVCHALPAHVVFICEDTSDG